MLERIRVRNFKAIADAELELTPLHLLIGPNDSGKTSFLEAIAALSRSLDHPIDRTFLGRWRGCQLVHSGSVESVVELEGGLTGNFVNDIYRLKCEFPGDNREIRLIAADWNGDERRDLIYGNDTCTGSASTVHAAKNTNFAVSTVLRDAIAPCWYLRWTALNLALPVTLDPNRRLRIDGSGFGLPTLLDDLLGVDRERFGQLEKTLCDWFPDVAQLKLYQEEAFSSPIDDPQETLRLQPGNGKQLYFRLKNGNEIPAPQAAEGLLYALAYLAILHLPEPPKVLLVEEPENGIHPAMVRRIVGLLRRLTVDHPDTQVIMASHSPYLVDEMRPEEVTWLRRIAGNVVTQRLDKNETVQRQQGLFELGEIWSNYLDPLGGASRNEG